MCVIYITINFTAILPPTKDLVDFKWRPELQQSFDKIKKELKDGTLRSLFGVLKILQTLRRKKFYLVQL